jgi:hypothetical protein
VSRRTPGPSGSHDELGLIVGAIALLALAAASILWLPVALVEPPGYSGGGPFAVARGLVDGQPGRAVDHPAGQKPAHGPR